jgi:hypothetical protein
LPPFRNEISMITGSSPTWGPIYLFSHVNQWETGFNV